MRHLNAVHTQAPIAWMDLKFKVRLQKMARLALPFGYCGDTFNPFIKACKSPDILALPQKQVLYHCTCVTIKPNHLLRSLQLPVWNGNDVIQLL